MSAIAATREGWTWRRRLLAVLSAWGALAALFAVMAVFAAFYDYFPSDVRIAHAIQDIDVPVFGGFMDFVNIVGSGWVSVPLTFGLVLVFVVMRRGWEAAFLPFTLVVHGLNAFVKDLVERPRPSDNLVRVTGDASGYSFPSGHTVGTAALFGLLFFLLPAVVPSRPLRWLLQAGCLLAIAAAGPARVYVGVHWPSDALGAYLLACCFLLPLLAGYAAVRAAVASAEPEGKPQ